MAYAQLKCIQGIFTNHAVLFRLSDLDLVLVYSPGRAEPSIPSLDERPASSVMSESGSTDPGRKRKADNQEGLGSEDVEIRFPAHKFILVAMSDLFSSHLETAGDQAVAQAPKQRLRVSAESVDELYAMEAVVEMMYANGDQLPLLCTAPARPPGRSRTALSRSRLQRLLTCLAVSQSSWARLMHATALVEVLLYVHLIHQVCSWPPPR